MKIPMKRCSLPVILMVLALATSSFLWAEETASKAAPLGSGGKLSEKVRYIPFADMREILDQNPKGLLITKDLYESMKQAKEAYLARKPQSPMPKLDLDFCFGNADYRGTFNEKSAEFEATILFELPNERWVMLPLPSGDIGMKEVTLDGKPVGIVVERYAGIQDEEAPKNRVAILQQRYSAAMQNRKISKDLVNREGRSNEFLVALKGPGRHTLKIQFVVPKPEDPTKTEITFRIPRVPTNTFSVLLDKSGQFGEVDRSEGTQSAEAQGKTQVSGVLGSTDRFTLRWAPKTIAAIEDTPDESVASEPGQIEPVQVRVPPKPVEPPRMYADSYTLLSFGEGYVQSDSLIKVNITRSPKGKVVFDIPKGTEFLDIRSDWLESFDQVPTATCTRIVCRLKSQVQSTIDFSLSCDTKIPGASQTVVAPVHVVEEVERDRGFLGVEARTSIEIRKVERNKPESELELSAVDPSELPAELSNRALRPILLAYRYNVPPVGQPLLIDIIRHKDIPVLTSAIDKIAATTVLEADETSETALSLQIKNNGQQYLEIRLPPDSEIGSSDLDGNPVKPVLKNEEAQKASGSKYLVPLGRSRTSGSSLEAFNLQIVYQTKVPKIDLWKKLEFQLPAFDIPASRLEWNLYGPDNYFVLPTRSNLDQAPRSIEFIPVRMIADFFESLTSPGGMALLLLVLVIYGLYRIIRGFSGGMSLSPATYAVGGVLFLVVAIAALTASGGSVKSMFATIPGRLDSAAGPAPAMVQHQYNEYERKKSRDMDDSPQSSMEMDGMAMGKQEMARPSAKSAPSSLNVLGKKTMVQKENRKAKMGRDRGALPVKKILPTSGRSLWFYRNIVRLGEETRFRGFIVWQPLESLVNVLIGLFGILTFCMIYLSASWSRPLLAGLLFTCFSVSLVLLEEFLPRAQEPGVLAFLACLVLILTLKGLRKISSLAKAGPAAAVIILLGTLASPGWAAQPPAGSQNDMNPQIEQLVDVYIPYTQLGDRLPKDSNLVFLKYDEYKYLKDLGIPEPDPARWTPPVGVSFVSGLYDAKVLEDRVEISFRFEIDLLGKGFKQISFPTDRVGVRSLTLNGEPAILANRQIGPMNNDLPQGMNMPPQMQQQQMIQQSFNARQMDSNIGNNSFRVPSSSFIVTEKEGRVTLEGTLVKDLFSKNEPKAKVEGFEIPLPAFSLAQLKILVNKPNQKVEVTPSAMVKSESAGQTTSVVAVLQPSETLKVEWRNRVQEKPTPIDEVATSVVVLPPPVAKEAKVFADHEVSFSVSEGVISVADQVKLNVEKSPVGEFLFWLPPGVEVIDVTGNDLAGWVCHQVAERQELKVTLNAQRLNRIDLRIEMERPTPQVNGEFPLDIPVLASVSPKGIIERQKGYFGVESREGLEVAMKSLEASPFAPKGTPTPPTSTRVDPQELPESIRNSSQGFMAHAFKFLGEINPIVNVTKHQNVEVSTAQIDGAWVRTLITREGKVLTKLDLVVRNNNNQFLVLMQLASESRLLSAQVNGEPVKPGIGKESEIYVPLIRSPRSGKNFQPFGVSLIFEDSARRLSFWGNFTLRLPVVSLDISEMNWEIDAQDGFFLVKGPGPFQKGTGNVPRMPGHAYGEDKQAARFSNVMTQAAISGGDETLEPSPSGAGLLPVNLEIPTTSNINYYHKKLIAAKNQGPRLQVFFFKETFLRVFCLLLTLLTGILLAHTLWGMACCASGSAKLGGFLLFLIGAGLGVAQTMIGEFIPFMGRFIEAFVSGLEVGLMMLFVWYLMTMKTETTPPAKGPRISPEPVSKA